MKTTVEGKMSTTGATTLAISSVIGAGVFTLANLAVQMGGPGISVLSWLITVLAIIPFLYVFHFLSQKYLKEGTLVQYAADALGPWSTTSISLLLVGTYIVLIPVVILAGTDYLQKVLGFSSTWNSWIAFGLLAASALVNLGGLSWLNRLNRLSFVLLLFILALLVGYNVHHLRTGMSSLTHVFTGSADLSFRQLGKIASLLLLSFVGWESVSFGVAELKNITRSLSKVYIFSFAAIVGIYLALALIVAGAAATGGAERSLSRLIEGVPYGQVLIYATALVIFSNISACLFAATRMMSLVTARHGERSVGATPEPSSSLNLGYFLVCAAGVLLIQSVFSLSLDTLVQMTNQNYMLIYSLCLVNFFRSEKRAYRWLILLPGMASTLFILAGFSWHFAFPAILLLVGLALTPVSAYRPKHGWGVRFGATPRGQIHPLGEFKLSVNA